MKMKLEAMKVLMPSNVGPRPIIWRTFVLSFLEPSLLLEVISYDQ
jgi:hypothetical protein